MDHLVWVKDDWQGFVVPNKYIPKLSRLLTVPRSFLIISSNVLVIESGPRVKSMAESLLVLSSS